MTWEDEEQISLTLEATLISWLVLLRTLAGLSIVLLSLLHVSFSLTLGLGSLGLGLLMWFLSHHHLLYTPPPVPTVFYYFRGINKEISSSFIDLLPIAAKCLPI